jgi:hypothetical protein
MMGLAGRGDEEKKHHITIRVTQDYDSRYTSGNRHLASQQNPC